MGGRGAGMMEAAAIASLCGGAALLAGALHGTAGFGLAGQDGPAELTVQELMRCSNGRAVLVLREKEGERRLLVPISVFYGRLTLGRGPDTFDVEARPADAVALALEQGAPMFAAREVLDRAGITPEEAVALRDSRKPPAAVGRAGPSQVLDI